MGTYILRRILLMFPTLFAISLIVFVIVNFAPGAPGETASAQGQESADESGSKREAYRIFKETFNLDKPILLNFRYALKEEEIRQYVADIARCNPDVKLKDIIHAEETLENYGQYAVPHLVAIIRSTKQAALRHVAVKKFSENARGRLFRDYRHIEGPQAVALKKEFDQQHPELLDHKSYPVEVVNYINKKVEQENAYIKSLWYRLEDPPARQKEVISKILQWYQKHRAWYQYSLGRKIHITLLDTRFARYWWNLLHLDFGISHVDKKPVLQTVLSKMRYSVTLSFVSLILAYLIAVPLGIFSAVKQNSLADRVITVVVFMLYSLPTFFTATLLLYWFSEGGDYWRIFPAGGFQSKNYLQLTTWGQLKDILWHICLPITCLTYVGLASLSRYARSGLLDVIRSDYIKTARAKGLPEYLVILRHAVRNGMIPVLTLLAGMLPVLLGGSVVIEYVFGINGMGFLTVGAITARDYNTIMCVTLLSAVLVMIGILLSDISYALVDPRISFK